MSESTGTGGKGRGAQSGAPGSGKATCGKPGGGAPAKKSAKRSARKQEDRTILINFVLDKSGSMDIIRSATISGFNEFLGDQQREGGDARMTLTLFDTAFATVASAVPVREVTPLDLETYAPDGCTALYDAIGHTMRITDDYVAAHHPDQVLFVIMTDGQENASREFDQRRIFDLIKERQDSAGYEFIYLGANQDAYAASQQIGIAPGRALNWDANPAAAAATMTRMSYNVRGYRRMGAAQLESDEFFSEELERLGGTSYEEHKRKKK